MKEFQSAVAHELFSDQSLLGFAVKISEGFKALSRMSSSPTWRRRARQGHPPQVSKRCRA